MRKAEKRQKNTRTARNVGIAIVIVAIVFGVLKLVQGDSSSSNEVTCANVKPGTGTTATFTSPPPMTVDQTSLYVAVMDTSCGKITLGLNAVDFPVSVNNFVFLAQQKFYDGLDFVRASKNFTIQAGSPDNSQTGGPGYSVVGEVPKTTPAYPVGAFAMAKAGTEPAGTAGSQFFIITGKKNLSLPAEYAYVGKVTNGLAVAQKIESLAPKTGDGKPTTTVRINKVTVTVTASAATTTTAPATTTVAP